MRKESSVAAICNNNIQCFVIILLILYWVTTDTEFEKIPGPPGILFLQNSLDFLMDPVKLFYHFRMLSNKYKRLYRLQFGPVKVIILQNPEDIKAVINGTKHNTKGFIYDFIEPWLHDGVLLSTDAKWYQRRKLLTPAFHFNILQSFKLVFEENCQKLVEALTKEVNEPKTDIIPYLTDFAIQTLCETAMGAALDKEDNNYGKMYKEAIYKLGQYAVYRAQRIWMYPKFIFQFTTVARKQKNLLKVMAAFRDRIIENRRKLYNKSNNNFIDEVNCSENDEMHLFGKKKMAMLDLLLQAEKDGIIDAKGIGEEVDTFMFGGHDTITNTLQFTMMLLANHQDTQEKVINELHEIFGSSNRSATMNDLTQMKYLECCVKETMRLYPPVPAITRKIKESFKLKEYEIPAGTECAIVIFDLHRRPDQFIEPLEYRPERFQVEPTWHPYAYIPFSAGPRNCLGQKFAMIELKLALSAVLRRYRLLPVTKPSDIVFVSDYVLRLKEHIHVKFEERNEFTCKV